MTDCYFYLNYSKNRGQKFFRVHEILYIYIYISTNSVIYEVIKRGVKTFRRFYLRDTPEFLLR